MTINEQCVTESAYKAYRQMYQNGDIEKWNNIFKTSSIRIIYKLL